MWFYRFLLLAYPASFRAEYGEELCAVFSRERDQTAGWLRLGFWMRAIFDVAVNAMGVHLDILQQDVRYAVRTLGRAPGFALTAILVAALGIGATTAAFTMVDHVLIRPLPFPDEGRLVKLYEDKPAQGFHDDDVSPANYRDWKQMSASFENVGAYSSAPVNLVGEGDPQTLP